MNHIPRKCIMENKLHFSRIQIIMLQSVANAVIKSL